MIAELAYWLGRAGEPVAISDNEHPYAILAQGDWRRAAKRWRDAGHVHEAAMADSQSPEAAVLLDCLPVLD